MKLKKKGEGAEPDKDQIDAAAWTWQVEPF